MTNFRDWKKDEREKSLSNRITTELLVDRETLGFENIETDLIDTNLDEEFEVPPIIMDKIHLAQIMLFAPQNDKGRWLLTMLYTYTEGGTVIYRQHDKDNFVAILKF